LCFLTRRFFFFFFDNRNGLSPFFLLCLHVRRQMQDDNLHVSRFGAMATTLSAAVASGHGAGGGGGGGGSGDGGGDGGPPDSDDDLDLPDDEDHSDLYDGASSRGVRHAATDATLDMVSVPTAPQLELAEFNATVAAMKLLETLQSGSLSLLQEHRYLTIHYGTISPR
jgi:hypothetical protein